MDSQSLRSFIFGLTLPARALVLILRSPTLLAWSAIPIVLTLGLYLYLLLGIESWAHAWIMSWLTQWGIAPAGIWGTLVGALTWLILIFASAMTFSSAAAIISAPFNDFLAEKTEPRASPPLPACPSPSLGGRIRLLFIDILKAIFGAWLAIVAMVMSWIPVINLIALPLAFAIICFQFVSYPQTRRGEGLMDAVKFIWQHKAACLGFGASFTALFAVPLLSCFVVPIAVVGGTLLYARVSAGESAAAVGIKNFPTF